MSFTSQGGHSSPDPLAVSQDGAFSPKPRGRRTSTPTTGNNQPHEIVITTPEARKAKGKSPSKSRETDEPSESPWHIRITVQAEQTGSRTRTRTSTPKCSPSKIFSERTFTTKVPLKASDESPVHRKVKGTPRKRRSSPAEARSASRGRQSETPKLDAQSSKDDAHPTSPSVPKRGRGRPRMSTIPPRSTSGSRMNERHSNNSYPKLSISKRTFDRSDLWIEDQMGDPDHKAQRSFDSDSEPREFDSVLESEGFSMVSVSSLPSAQSASGNVTDSGTSFNNLSASPPKRHVTPSPAQHLPIPPPPPKPAPMLQSGREVNKSTTGTPRLARVVRAGIALQGVLSPVNHRQGSRQPSWRFNSSSPISASMSPKERLDDLFSGFGPGTRRELRAGLRLGEELAKRQNVVMRPDSHLDTQNNEDIFNANPDVRYPQLPDTDRAGGYSLKVPGSAMTASPSFSNNQLPSPARSEVDADDDRMSWRVDTLPQHAAPPRPPKELGTACSANAVSSPIDPTMVEREAEWRREREAVSRQIQDANSSQVIIIHSDDDEEDDDRSVSSAEVDIEEDGDIWQEEAQNSQTSQKTSDTPPIFRQTEAPKPRRSQLPSPWMRKSKDLSEITRPVDDSELLNQLGQTETPYEQSNAQESMVVTPTHVANQRKQWTSQKSESSSLDSASDDNGPEVSSDQELDSEDSFSNAHGHESHLLSQKSVQNDITGPLDEGSELDSNVVSIETSEEVPQPQTPLPQTSTPRSKTPKQVRFSEEAIRPRPSDLSAPESAPLPPSQFSWLNRVASLLPSWATSAPAAVPLPSRPRRKIRLSKVDQGPLPLYMPWTQVHWWALINIVRQSQADIAAIPYNSKMASARYLGSVVSVNKWSKKIVKQDCAVSEQFLEVLRARGTLKGIEAVALKGGRMQWGRVPGQLMDLDVVLSAVVSQWASDVQDGVCTIGWGDRAGLKQGSETEVWTKADIPVDGPRVLYV
ncbi:MAG: hypothetical protein LQ343_005436 [Gyalolechia ehrenbergii]|nr:MAG: hypothetical protein LQ343_005436 [Gyalolechia ehrenbergii]